MSLKKRLLVFHRNCLFRDCLASFLTHDRDFDATAVDHSLIDHSPVDAAHCSLPTPADVLLLDLNLPGELAVQIIRALSQSGSPTKVILLVPDDHAGLVDCIAAGAYGCVLERSSLNDLDVAIARVLAGEIFCSAEIVSTMFFELARISTAPDPPDSLTRQRTPLTAREREVLDLIARRKSNKEIASQLSVSLFTVKNHVHNILDKLDVDSRMEAVDLAQERHWLSTSTEHSLRPTA